MQMRVRMVLAEDDNCDVRLTMEVLRSANVREAPMVFADGRETLDFLYRESRFAGYPLPQPAVVLLDLKMPRMSGFEVLKRVKGDSSLRSIPIVVLTSSRLERDVARAYDLGANGYVVKALDFNEYTAALGAASRYWLEINETPPLCIGRAKQRLDGRMTSDARAGTDFDPGRPNPEAPL